MPINTTSSITELSAVGVISSYLGIPAPVDINDLLIDPDWIRSLAILKSVTKEALHKGLEENTDEDYTLLKEPDGTVLIPAGTLRWIVKHDTHEQYVQRDGMVYDKKAHTFTIDKDLVVDIVWNMTFDSLPEMIKNYITIKAAYRVVSRLKGSDSVLNSIQQDLDDANYEYLRYQGRNNKMSLLDNPDVNYIASRHMQYNHHLR